MIKVEEPRRLALFLLVLAVYTFAIGSIVNAQPQGATVTNESHDDGPTFTADNRSDDGGTINTLTLDSQQQNPQWKSYIGNVTGTLTLDDSNQNTIYDWSLSSISGEVYVSRNSTINWEGDINCSSPSTIDSEESFYTGMSSGDSDNINNTFNATQHEQMDIGTNTVGPDTCPTAYTYVNSSAQTPNTNNNFTSILLEDNQDRLIYATFIEPDIEGFDNNPRDFQTIVPDHDDGTITTFYFYLELS